MEPKDRYVLPLQEALLNTIVQVYHPFGFVADARPTQELQARWLKLLLQ